MILASVVIMIPVFAKVVNTGENNGNGPSVDCPADNGDGYASGTLEHNWKCYHPVTIENATTAALYLVREVSGTSEDFTNWNGATVVVDTTYFDMTGKNASYSFDVMKNGQYSGYIIISATRDNYPILEFSKGITPDKDANTLLRAQQLAQSQITKPGEVLGDGKLVYLGATFFDMTFPVQRSDVKLRPEQKSNNEIIVDLIEGNIVNPSVYQLNITQWEQLRQNQQQKIAAANAAWDSIDNSANYVLVNNPVLKNSKQENIATVISPTVQVSSNLAVVIGGVPPFRWKYGCSPTSAAMVLGYWKNRGLTKLPYVTDTDSGNPLTYDLATAMGTTYSGDGSEWSCLLNPFMEHCGGTGNTLITPGINAILNKYGIKTNNGWSSHFDGDYNNINSFNDDATEIDNGYPFVLSMQSGGPADGSSIDYGDHSVTVFGYDRSMSESPLLMIFDTWSTTPVYIRYNNWQTATDDRIEPVTKYTIIATADRGGTITPSGSITILPYFNQTFIIKPDSGYSIGEIIVDDISSFDGINEYTFEDVWRNHKINVTFRQKNLPHIVSLCKAGDAFDSRKYPQDMLLSDPMVFTCNWDGNGRVYVSGNSSELIGVYADDGFTIDTSKGSRFETIHHSAGQHAPLDITSGMNKGSNTLTIIIRNWQKLSMSYGSKTGIGIDQEPYIIEVNNPSTSVAAAKMTSAEEEPPFFAQIDNGLIMNETLISN